MKKIVALLLGIIMIFQSALPLEMATALAEEAAIAASGNPQTPGEAETEPPKETDSPEETPAATEAPTEEPTEAPTEVPTAAPTEAPTEVPTAVPTEVPTAAPTAAPTEAPTAEPTEAPTEAPEPTEVPEPTASPSPAPTETPAPDPLTLTLAANARNGYMGEATGFTATLAGGLPPYTLDWAQGRAEGIDSSEYTFDCTPDASGEMTVTLNVTDSLGTQATASVSIPVAVHEGEDEDTWKRSIAGAGELTGDWRDDLVAVAETQRGYAPSGNDFYVDGDGVRHSYSRYGAWYGNAYADRIDAAFVSFCLNYARVPEEDVPRSDDSDRLCQDIDKLGALENDRYTPAAGDLVFFWTEDARVGIVTDVSNGEMTFIMANGNRRAVGQTWSIRDYRVEGFANMTKLMIRAGKLEPTAAPTEKTEPTAEPTEAPTAEPTEEPTAEPTEKPTEEPTAEPAKKPAKKPIAAPTAEPTEEPTPEPTSVPTPAPTATAAPATPDEAAEKPATEPTVKPATPSEAEEEPTAEPTAKPVVPAAQPATPDEADTADEAVQELQIATPGEAALNRKPLRAPMLMATNPIMPRDTTPTFTVKAFKNDTEITSNPTKVQKTDSIKFALDFIVPPHALDDSPSITYQVKGVKLENPMSGFVMQPGTSTHVGTYTIGTDGLVTITFDENYVKRNTDPDSPVAIKGDLSATVKVSETTYDNTGKAEIKFEDDFTLGLDVTDFDVSSQDLSVSKDAPKVDSKTGTITYLITVSSSNGTGGVINLEDVMTNVTTKGDFKVKDGNGKDVTGWTSTNNDGSFTIDNLPALQPGGRYTIEYTAQCKPEDLTAYTINTKNRVKVTSKTDKDYPLRFEYEIEKEIKPDLVKKSGVFVEDGKVKWTVIVNEDCRDISGWELSDKLNGVAYKGEVTIEPPIDGLETPVKLPITFPEGTKKTYTITYVTDNDMVPGANAAKNIATMTPPSGSGKNPVNSEEVGPEGATGDGYTPQTKSAVGKPQEDLEQGIVTYTWRAKIEASKGTIYPDWKIEDNVLNGQWFTGKQLRDAVAALMSSAKAAMGSDVKIVKFAAWRASLPGANDARFESLTAFSDVERLTGFEITFDKPLEKGKSIEFTYESTSEVKNEETTVQNKLKVNNVEITAENTYKPSSRRPTIEKTDVTAGNTSSDASTQHEDVTELKWKIKVTIPAGYDADKDGDLTITERLPDGITPTGMSIHPSTGSTVSMALSGVTSVDGHDVTIAQDSTNQNIYTITIPGGLAAKTASGDTDGTIEFELTCAINEDYAWAEGDKTVTTGVFGNTVILTNKDGKDIGTDTQTQTITRNEMDNLISKKATGGTATNNNSDSAQKFARNVIPYSIVINPEGKDLLPNRAELTLYDEMEYDANQNKGTSISVDPATVKVYEYDAATQTKIRKFNADEFAFSYTEQPGANGHMINTITMSLPDDKCLLIEYDCMILKGSGEYNLTNKVKLKGIAETTNSEENKIKVQYDESVAHASIVGITLFKIGNNNMANLLSGAKFKLEAWDETQKAYVPVCAEGSDTPREFITENGFVNIDNLEYNRAYRLTETGMTADLENLYIPNPDPFYFFIVPPKDVTTHSFIGPDDFYGKEYNEGSVAYYSNASQVTNLKVRKSWIDELTGKPTNPTLDSIEVTLYQVKSAVPPGGDGNARTGQIIFKCGDTVDDHGLFGGQTELVYEYPVGTQVSFQFMSASDWTPNIQLSLNGKTQARDPAEAPTGQYTTYTWDVGPVTVESQPKFYVVNRGSNSNNVDWDLSITNIQYPETDAKAYITVTLDKDNKWQVEVPNLPRVGTENGQTVYYTYEARETSPANANVTTTYDGDRVTLTNRVKAPKAAVNVEKLWLGADGLDCSSSLKEGAYIRVQLYQKIGNSEPQEYGNPITLDATNQWKGSFQNLPRTVDGKPCTYSVKEISSTVHGFEVSYTYQDQAPVTNGTQVSIEDGNVTITNRQPSTSVKVEKKWLDLAGDEMTPPSNKTAEIQLYRKVEGGTPDPVTTVTLPKDGKWTYEFTGLPAKDEKEREYAYYVVESGVPAGYTVSYEPALEGEDASAMSGSVSASDTSNLITVTNHKQTTSLTVTKAWESIEGYGVSNPTEIQVQLYQKVKGAEGDGSPLGEPIKLNSSGWTYTFDDLPTEDPKTGEEYVYYAREVSTPDGFAVTYDPPMVSGTDASSSMTITNTEAISLTVTKEWKNFDGTSLENDQAVRVQLYRKVGEDGVIEPVKPERIETLVKKDGKWTATFDRLPYCQGNRGDNSYKVITYYVKEVDTLEDYAVSYSSLVMDDTFGYLGQAQPDGTDVKKQTATITNRKKDLTSLKVDKKWMKNDQDITSTYDGESSVRVALHQMASGMNTRTVTFFDEVYENDYQWSYSGDTFKIEWIGTQHNIVDTARYPAGSTVTYTITATVKEGKNPGKPPALSIGGTDLTPTGTSPSYTFTYACPVQAQANQNTITLNRSGNNWNYNEYNWSIAVKDVVFPDATDELFGEYVITKDNNWHLEIPNLPKQEVNAEGDLITYAYELHEIAPASQSGMFDEDTNTFTITNTVDDRPKTTWVSVKKLWQNSTSGSMAFPEGVTVKVSLYRKAPGAETGSLYKPENDPSYVNPAELTRDEPSHAFLNLPKDDSTYYVVETTLEGYTASYQLETATGEGSTNAAEVTVPANSGDDRTIVITNKKEETEIYVKKTWPTDINDDEIKDVEVKVRLYRLIDGKVSPVPDVEPITLTKAEQWENHFSNLPKNDDQGQPIQYFVAEIEGPEGFIASYTPASDQTTAEGGALGNSTADGVGAKDQPIEIHNARTPATSIKIVKAWEGTNKPLQRKVYLSLSQAPVSATSDDAYKPVDLGKLQARNDKGVIEGPFENGEYYIAVNVPAKALASEPVELKGLPLGMKFRVDEVGYDDNGTFKPLPADRAMLLWKVSSPNEVAADGTVTVTNTVKPTTSIEVQKYWTLLAGTKIDNAAVKVQLYRKIGDNAIEPTGIFKELRKNAYGVWKNTFSNLPAETDDGTPITYYVREESVMLNGKDVTDKFVVTYGDATEAELADGKKVYLAPVTEDGTGTIVLTNEEKVKLSFEKKWLAAEGTTLPESVTVELYTKSGDSFIPVGKTLTLSAENLWAGSFTGLDAHDEKGQPIAYYVKETGLSDGFRVAYSVGTTPVATETITTETDVEEIYAPVKDDTTVTITNTEFISIGVSKAWTEDSTPDGNTIVQVQLYQKVGEKGPITKMEGKTLTFSGETWSGSFTDLEARNADGEPITYYVREASVTVNGADRTDKFEVTYGDVTGVEAEDGNKVYPIPANGARSITITNKKMELIDLHVRKSWPEGADQDSITVGLYKMVASNNGEDRKTIKFVEYGMAWKEWTTSTLENKKDGNNIILTDDNNGKGYVPGTKITYTFEGNYDQWNTVGVKIKVGEKETSLPKKLSSDGKKYTFTYTYTVNAGDNTITLTREQVSLGGWTIEREGEPEYPEAPELIDYYTISADKDKNKDWKLTIPDLPKKDASGKPIKYEIKEIGTGYKVDYSTDDDGTVVITNTKPETPPDKAEIIVVKQWQDKDGNPLTTLPEDAKVWVQLHQKVGETDQVYPPDSQPVELSAAKNKWMHRFSDLPKTVEGQPCTYYVVETKIEPETIAPNYAVSYSPAGDIAHGTILVTNSEDPETIDVTVNKQWKSASDADITDDSKLPDSITVQLYKLVGNSYEAVDTPVIIEKGKDGSWTHTFQHLPKYDDQNQLIQYFVKESDVDGFKPTYNEGSVDTKDTLTNVGILGEVDAATNTATIINTEQTLTITKQWQQNGGTIAPAKCKTVYFELLTVDGTNETPFTLTDGLKSKNPDVIVSQDDKNYIKVTFDGTTETEKSVTLYGLPAGKTYKVKEVGYLENNVFTLLPEDGSQTPWPWTAKYDAMTTTGNTSTITVTNTLAEDKIYELPATGGQGTTALYASGTLLLMLAALLLAKKRRRSEA